ncbi:glycosyltransferase [bacterium]|nr:glycosyltransferase [bacterium]
MGKVFYIGNFDFPKGNAPGIRVLNNGYLLRNLGYQVHYIGLSSSVTSQNLSELNFQSYDGFSYARFQYPKALTDWIFFGNKLSLIKKVLLEERPVFIIMYGSLSNSLFFLLLVGWCRKNDIIVFSDCVDWLHLASGSLFFRIFKNTDTFLQKRVFNRLADGIIAVSSHLASFYQNLGINTVVIPPLNSSKTPQRELLRYSDSKRTPVSLFYAGYPFSSNAHTSSPELFKDRLDLTIDYLVVLNDLCFVFNIYGISKEDYLKVVPRHCAILTMLEGKVYFHGKVDNDLVEHELTKADYIILLRNSNRMTNFGFPSKITEAMGFNIPAITTRTSDLECYIKNGENGYFIDIDNESIACQQIRDILENHSLNYTKIYSACLKNNPFHYSKYLNVLSNFLSRAQKK